MGYVNNFYDASLSVRSIKLQKDEPKRGQEEINEKVDKQSQSLPEAKPVIASALDVMACLAKSEISIKGQKDTGIKPKETEEPEVSGKGNGQSYEELTFLYYDMCQNNATDEELIPILREIIEKWTPDSLSMFGESRNLWQSTLAYRINRAYLADTLNYLEEGGNPMQINFDEIESFETDLANVYKIPRDKYYTQNRKSVYGALVNLYSIMLMRPGLSEEDRLKIETKLEDARTRLAQFE